MALKPTITMSADASLTRLGYVKGFTTIQVGGSTFGGGTLTLFVSIDSGATKNALKDGSGVAYSTTGVDTFTADLPKVDDKSRLAQLYATLAGSTSPNITIKISDEA